MGGSTNQCFLPVRGSTFQTRSGKRGSGREVDAEELDVGAGREVTVGELEVGGAGLEIGGRGTVGAVTGVRTVFFLYLATFASCFSARRLALYWRTSSTDIPWVAGSGGSSRTSRPWLKSLTGLSRAGDSVTSIETVSSVGVLS